MANAAQLSRTVAQVGQSGRRRGWTQCLAYEAYVEALTASAVECGPEPERRLTRGEEARQRCTASGRVRLMAICLLPTELKRLETSSCLGLSVSKFPFPFP